MLGKVEAAPQRGIEKANSAIGFELLGKPTPIDTFDDEVNDIIFKFATEGDTKQLKKTIRRHREGIMYIEQGVSDGGFHILKALVHSLCVSMCQVDLFHTLTQRHERRIL